MRGPSVKAGNYNIPKSLQERSLEGFLVCF